MKKSLLLVLVSTAISGTAFAIHNFNICYYNNTNHAITYNNDGVLHKWKHKGTLEGSGTIAANEHKCFVASDETIFTSHYKTFYVNNKWYGIVNPGFSKPYVVSQGATNTSGAKLEEEHGSAEDNYNLSLLVSDTGVSILNSSDPKSSGPFITPRVLTK